MSRRPPLDHDAVRSSVRAAVLEALAGPGDLGSVVRAADPGDDRAPLVAGDALLDLAASALGLAVPHGAEPLEYADLRPRYLPEVEFRGRVEHRNSQYVLYAAACRRGGLDPDIDSDTGWWGAPLWLYAAYAVVIYARAAAERLGCDVPAVAERLREALVAAPHAGDSGT